jgi:hypothetical protein
VSRGAVVERDSEGRALRMIGTHMDITEQKPAEAENTRLQEQLLQAQKLESVGTLTIETGNQDIQKPGQAESSPNQLSPAGQVV